MEIALHSQLRLNSSSPQWSASHEDGIQENTLERQGCGRTPSGDGKAPWPQAEQIRACPPHERRHARQSAGKSKAGYAGGTHGRAPPRQAPTSEKLHSLRERVHASTHEKSEAENMLTGMQVLAVFTNRAPARRSTLQVPKECLPERSLCAPVAAEFVRAAMEVGHET